MRTLKPTAVKEDYLRALFRSVENGNTSIVLADIAKHLHLSKSTVTERIQDLVREGYLIHEKYGGVHFTPEGFAIAKKLTHKHRVIEVFLHTTLKIPKHEVHAEAHLLEHAVSDKVLKKLVQFLKNPKLDPHGATIPKSK